MKVPLESVALYGGSFDPVHRGHLAVARAAAKKFDLQRVYFVPTYVQPLKAEQQVTNYYHRYAMLSLALAGEDRFVPSLLEAPETTRLTGRRASYTVDTVARMRAGLKDGTRLYFLIGMDAFLHIAKWRLPVELLRSAEFIVASRPGFPLKDIVCALPKELQPRKPWPEQAGTIEANGAKIHLLPDVHEEVSATAIREAVKQGKRLKELVPAAVADYIVKLKIYAGDPEPGAPELPGGGI